MSKIKALIGVTVLLVIGASVWAAIRYKSSRSQLNTSTSLSPTNSETEEVEATLVYDDASGFSFRYPEEVQVIDKTPEEDETYYTLLELTKEKGAEGGEISITVKDVKYKTVDDWSLKDETAPKNLNLVGATTLGDIKVNQYSYESVGAGEFLVSVGIDQGVLYLIEGPKDSGFWEATHNAIVSTFTFSGSTPKALPGENVIYEEEEVVE